MNCSPNTKVSSKCKSCFDKNDLLQIVSAFNKKNKKKNITIKTKNKTQIQLWNDLRKKLSSTCKKEVCWIDQDFLSSPIKQTLKEKFKPLYPPEWKKNKTAWLSTTDINEVMIQYEKLYKNFAFFGPVPVDCPNGIHCELTTLNPLKLKKNNIDIIGIIFNLDYHHQSGSHWVALVIDTTSSPYYIDFFDSYGEEPHRLIKKFMEDMDKKISKDTKTIQMYNNKRHQFGHSECGVYSMNYILQRLKGKTPADLTNNIIKDKVMNEMRKYLYRPD
jgi:hypothetical protein